MLKNNSDIYFHANGKLLLTSEYLVLDGAIAFALPTKLGQSLSFENTSNSNAIEWKSVDCEGNIWHYEIIDRKFIDQDPAEINDEVSRYILKIFQFIENQIPNFIENNLGKSLQFHLDFPRNWGLGTSSTLISLISQWANINPYELLNYTFGGSGYDIACATAHAAIEFQLIDSKPIVKDLLFEPNFKKNLFFIYLEQKQNSRNAIHHYRKKQKPSNGELLIMNQLSEELFYAKDILAFESAIVEHELFISKFIGLNPIKDQLFRDYWGAIKSLGAWGGDFVLATSTKDHQTTLSYFKDNGYNTVFLFSDLVK